MIPASDVIALAQLGSPEQWVSLQKESGGAYDYLEGLAGYYPLLAAMAAEKAEVKEALLRPHGARLDTLSPGIVDALGIPAGTPRSARVVCGDGQKLSQRVMGANMNRVIWMLVLDGEDDTFAPNRSATASQGGILKHVVYAIPQAAK